MGKRLNDRNGRFEADREAETLIEAASAEAEKEEAALPPRPGARFAKPSVQGRQQGVAPGDATSPAVSGLFPAVVAFLSDGEWSNGDVRVTGTMTVFVEAGQFKACLTCRATCRKAFLSGRSFGGLLESVERALDDGMLDWRRDGAKK